MLIKIKIKCCLMVRWSFVGNSHKDFEIYGENQKYLPLVTCYYKNLFY